MRDIKNLSIVIPVLNESNNIQFLTDRIIKNLKNIKYEVIFVDDNSVDSSYKILRSLKKNIALAMIAIKYSNIGGKFKVKTNDDEFNCTIVEKPFYDPKKKIASS